MLGHFQFVRNFEYLPSTRVGDYVTVGTDAHRGLLYAEGVAPKGQGESMKVDFVPRASRIPNQFNKHRHSTELIYTTPTLGPKDAFNY